jgi:hypothetical protein
MLAEDGKWFRVSLRLSGDALNPVSVEAALGLKPSIVGLKGQPRRGKAGRVYAPYETNVWVYQHDAPEDMPFEDQLTSLFSLLGCKIAELKKLCKTEGVEGDIFLGFSSGNGQGGDTLSSAVLSQIADVGLSLCLDLYPPDVQDSEPGAAPNGGPATPVGNSEATEGPPSVS